MSKSSVIIPTIFSGNSLPTFYRAGAFNDLLVNGGACIPIHTQSSSASSGSLFKDFLEFGKTSGSILNAVASQPKLTTSLDNFNWYGMAHAWTGAGDLLEDQAEYRAMYSNLLYARDGNAGLTYIDRMAGVGYNLADNIADTVDLDDRGNGVTNSVAWMGQKGYTWSKFGTSVVKNFPVVEHAISATLVVTSDDKMVEFGKQSLNTGVDILIAFGVTAALTGGWSLVAQGVIVGAGIVASLASGKLTDHFYTRENMNAFANRNKSSIGILCLVDPLILDLSGNDKIDLLTLPQSNVLFDMNMNGLLEHTAWVATGDGLLVLDKDNNGIIDNISEIFSEFFDPRADSALAALKLLDTNYDNKFDASDEKFTQVQIWVDANSDGITDAGELKTLAAHGITSIDLHSAEINIEDELGNVRTAVTSATQNGQETLVEEVALLVSNIGVVKDKTEDGITHYIGYDGSVLAVNHGNQDITLNVSEKNITTYFGGGGIDNISSSGKKSAVISGGDGNDILTGAEGNDFLTGEKGADQLIGGGGDDILFIDSADSVVDGGEGWDTVFINEEFGMVFDAASHNIEAIFGGDGDDTISTSGNHKIAVTGGDGNDVLNGADGEDKFEGGEGNDSINGGSGRDTAIYSGNKADYTIVENANGSRTVTDNRVSIDGVVNNGTDTLVDIERIHFDDDVLHTDNTNNSPIVFGGKMEVRNLDALTITAADLLDTATDEDDDYLSIAGIGRVIGGLASIDKDGNVIFKPRDGFSGKASFEYTVDDGHGGRTTGKAEIEVKPDLPTDNLFEQQWYLKAANIVPVWDDYIGRGVKVGILDDGITSHPDLNVDLATDLIKIDYTAGDHPYPL